MSKTEYSRKFSIHFPSPGRLIINIYEGKNELLCKGNTKKLMNFNTLEVIISAIGAPEQ